MLQMSVDEREREKEREGGTFSNMGLCCVPFKRKRSSVAQLALEMEGCEVLPTSGGRSS